MLKSNVEISEKQLLDETVGEDIGYDLGVQMVKSYFDRFGEGNAQFVGKNILSSLINQPNCVGINIYNALNEKGEKTFVLVGLDKENKPILETTIVTPNGELNKEQGIVADRIRGTQGWFDL